jgi:hypothetical protein
MTLQCDDADESRGLPGDEGIIGKKCRESVEVIAGNSSLSEGAVYGQGRMVCQNSMKMTPT